MRTLLLAGLAALSTAALPVSAAAQDAATPMEPAPQTADEANAEAAPLPSTTTVIPGSSPDEPDIVIEDHHGNLTPPPPEELEKTYPVCSGEVTDECRNDPEVEAQAEAVESDQRQAEPEGR